MKWYNFKSGVSAARQKLPPERKDVIVEVENLKLGALNPLVVGYLKYHGGDKSLPCFVTPGCTIESPPGDERVIRWCDCLPDEFDSTDKAREGDRHGR